ncbi:hypothetical protein FHR85_000576 [Alkalibacillus almallahensis]|nr:hypothetical protein [Alkalibacillus almallahensis]
MIDEMKKNGEERRSITSEIGDTKIKQTSDQITITAKKM